MTLYTILLSIFLCVISAVVVSRWKRKKDALVKAVNKIKGPSGLFLLGNMDEIGAKPEKAFEIGQQLIDTYGPVVRLWFLYEPVILITKVEYLEKILSSTTEITKSLFYKFLHPWLGTGLLTSTGEKWRIHRKMITPTFHFTMLDSFVEIFVDKSDKFVNNLEKIEPGAEFDICPYLSLVTLDVICHAAMGVDINAQQLDELSTEGRTYVASHTILTKALMVHMFKPLLWVNWMFYLFNSQGRQVPGAMKTLHGFTAKVIAERKAQRAEMKNKKTISDETDDQIGIKRKKALLDVLLDAAEDSEKISDHEIQEEVDTFMFEGNDTTSNGLAWLFLILGNHPEVQDKIIEELDEIFQGSQRRIVASDLVEMKYLERVIKESLRLFPSVPSIGRTLQKDLDLGDCVLPAGCHLKIEIGLMQRDPRYFENPNVFDPDNFLPERMRSRNPYSYLTFSAGPRNCIGQKFAVNQMKVLVATTLSKFRLESIHKVEEVGKLSEMTLRPINGIKLRISPRNK